uniref:PDZ domain-containing protein n=1 Tax=Magnetococcus massalia (strain MO-1) TaxID=451514 RepID=A0A1S7LK52_MAGMO|nr:conserved exported protein of unknown function [Include PDZ domain] [Candidatus Magnetococcus massalia]
MKMNRRWMIRTALAWTLVMGGSALSSSSATAGGWLGASINTPKGVQIGEIIKDSPADKAGLQRGDIILKLNGQPVMGPRPFAHQITMQPPGEKVSLEVMRQGKLTELHAVLDDSREHTSLQGLESGYGQAGRPGMNMNPNGMMQNLPFGNMFNMNNSPQRGGPAHPPASRWQNQRPPMPPHAGRGQVLPPKDWHSDRHPPQRELPPLAGSAKPWLGVAVKAHKKGVEVEGIAPQSPVSKAGLKKGDVITQLDREPIKSAKDLVDVVSRTLPGQPVIIHLERAGRYLMLQADVGARPEKPTAKKAP